MANYNNLDDGLTRQLAAGDLEMVNRAMDVMRTKYPNISAEMMTDAFNALHSAFGGFGPCWEKISWRKQSHETPGQYVDRDKKEWREYSDLNHLSDALGVPLHDEPISTCVEEVLDP